MRRATAALAATAALSIACGSSRTPSMDASVASDAPSASDASVPTADTRPPAPARDAGPLVAARPYDWRAPSGYDGSHALPLVILLHGYGASGEAQDLYFGLGLQVNALGFLYAYPNGTIDAGGRRFWNATDACCDLGHTGVDDVAYINAIIDDMSARYRVDPARVFVVGHSNGGFMSHRLACDASARVAAIVSLAGANWLDMSRCRPTRPVSVLDVHGDADTTISYTGGTTVGVAAVGGAMYPGEAATMMGWASRNGCGAMMDTGTTLDLDTSLPGSETTVSRFAGCMPGGATELWTIHGGGHIPALNAAVWAPSILNWLFAHGR